jgi:hypothetical protein
MGCFQSRDSYENPVFPEEKNIRKWEISLGLRDKIFYEIVSSFNSKIILEGEEISHKKLDSFLIQDFTNPDVSIIFQHSFFKNKNKIDCKYIKFLFLLMCSADRIPESNGNKSKILDKVEYMYNVVTNAEDDNFKRLDLELLLEPLFVISCEILPQSYINCKYTTKDILEEENYLLKLKDYTMQIKNKFFDIVFCASEKDEISLEDLNKRVLESPEVF